MRDAIAELNLSADIDTDAPNGAPYGQHLEFDDDTFSGTASGDDIWDIISDEYEKDYSTDSLDSVPDRQAKGNAYDQTWLAERCAAIARNGSALDTNSLMEQITAVLASDSNGK